MPKKQKYRIHNWKEYNKALVNRGSLTVWFDKSSMSSWYNDIKNSVNASRGRPQVYSDLAIECCLTLKTVFKLPLRATQGFVDSLIKIMKLPIKSPHYSLLSIRQKEINLTMNKVLNSENREKMHVVIDSTGLKIYGEGEWKIKKHGKEKRRGWLKLHLAIDEKSHSIISHVITGSNTHDCEVLSELLEKIEGDICQVTGDGAYDTYNSYRLAIEKGATPCFPPRVTAVRQYPIDEAHRLRNHAVSQVRYHSLSYWKRKNKYHRRSLAETAMFRFKQLVGSCVQARNLERQAVEIQIKCHVLNKMASLGMPLSRKI